MSTRPISSLSSRPTSASQKKLEMEDFLNCVRSKLNIAPKSVVSKYSTAVCAINKMLVDQILNNKYNEEVFYNNLKNFLICSDKTNSDDIKFMRRVVVTLLFRFLFTKIDYKAPDLSIEGDTSVNCIFFKINGHYDNGDIYNGFVKVVDKLKVDRERIDNPILDCINSEILRNIIDENENNYVIKYKFSGASYYKINKDTLKINWWATYPYNLIDTKPKFTCDFIIPAEYNTCYISVYDYINGVSLARHIEKENISPHMFDNYFLLYNRFYEFLTRMILEHGMLHNDLHTGNIFIDRTNNCLVLIDYGRITFAKYAKERKDGDKNDFDTLVDNLAFRYNMSFPKVTGLSKYGSVLDNMKDHLKGVYVLTSEYDNDLQCYAFGIIDIIKLTYNFIYSLLYHHRDISQLNEIFSLDFTISFNHYVDIHKKSEYSDPFGFYNNDKTKKILTDLTNNKAFFETPNETFLNYLREGVLYFNLLILWYEDVTASGHESEYIYTTKEEKLNLNTNENVELFGDGFIHLNEKDINSFVQWLKDKKFDVRGTYFMSRMFEKKGGNPRSKPVSPTPLNIGFPVMDQDTFLNDLQNNETFKYNRDRSIFNREIRYVTYEEKYDKKGSPVLDAQPKTKPKSKPKSRAARSRSPSVSSETSKVSQAQAASFTRVQAKTTAMKAVRTMPQVTKTLTQPPKTQKTKQAPQLTSQLASQLAPRVGMAYAGGAVKRKRYENCSVSELKEKAKNKNIKNYSKMTKDELIKSLRNK